MNPQMSPGQRLRDAVLHSPSAQSAPHADSTSPGVSGRDTVLPLEPKGWSLRAAFAALFSFEFLFVLFLLAGRIKSNPHLAWLPVDMTALFFALSVIAGALIVMTKKVNRYGLVIAAALAAFVTWLTVSLSWTPSIIYAHQKALYSVLSFWACAGAAVIIAADRARVRRFLTLVVVFALWYAIEGLIAYATAETRSFLQVGGANYFLLGDLVGCGAVIALATLISLRRRGTFKVMLAVLFALFFFIVLVAGARQPLLGLTIALVLAAVIGFRTAPGGIAFKRFQRGAWALLLAAAVAIVALIATGSMTQTLARFQTLFYAEDGGRSAAARQVAWAQAFDFWTSAPIVGHGVGSYPILENWVTDERRHPHNIFLETLCELGLVGLILLSLFLLVALRCIKFQRLREDALFRCIFLLAVYQCIASMVTTDLSEHRLLYSALGLLALPELQPIARPSMYRTGTPQRGRILLGVSPRRPQQQL